MRKKLYYSPSKSFNAVSYLRLKMTTIMKMTTTKSIYVPAALAHQAH
jgi:hypothetical protein